MSVRKEHLAVAVVIILALVSLSGPYLYAWENSGEDTVFGGFLFNPIDGNSYLAKMYQGWRGDTQFTLPYTAEPGEGAYLFLFYLGLGHLARWLNIDRLLLFHVTRLLAAVFLYFVLYLYIKHTGLSARERLLAFIAVAFGAGLGWFALLFGLSTADFWVAEAFPWLTSYANPHFPLSLGLMLLLLLPPGRDNQLRSYPVLQGFLIAFAALILSIISPFGIILVILILVGVEILRVIGEMPGVDVCGFDRRIIWVLLGGVPFIIYDLWVIAMNPVLSIWNSQNKTPSPPIWDFILSFSPLILLSIIGIYHMFSVRKGKTNNNVIVSMAVWFALGVGLLYLPIGLQRRFLIGLYIPVAVIGVVGLSSLFKKGSTSTTRKYRLLGLILILLIIPTNLLILLSARYAVQTQDRKVYLWQDERKAFQWLESNTAGEALILAAPETGLFIPAYTGRRVLYGHPFETVNAIEQEKRLNAVYTGKVSGAELESFVVGRGVDYIFYGPRERDLGPVPSLPDSELVYDQGQVMIFATKNSH
jgi:hypothetical protein